jgi:hypothetical protein
MSQATPRSRVGRTLICCFAAGAIVLAAHALVRAQPAGQGQAARVDLAQALSGGKLRVANRQATALEGDRTGIHLDARPGKGVAWVEGSDFGEGTIEVDIRGRDAFQRSFVGVAFHRADDTTYEAVYLRPFNFRSEDPVRREHAVQYIADPDYDWPRLRKEFPEEFENPVDQSIEPTGWVPVRLVVKADTIQVFVGPGASPALEVRKLGKHSRGTIGLWTGNNSEGDFANLRYTPAP